MNWRSFIDYSVEEGSGLKLGDILEQKVENQYQIKSKVIGFDKDGCPFVECIYVKYADGYVDERFKPDAFEIGDVSPFPWSNPIEFKVK